MREGGERDTHRDRERETERERQKERQREREREREKRFLHEYRWTLTHACIIQAGPDTTFFVKRG